VPIETGNFQGTFHGAMGSKRRFLKTRGSGVVILSRREDTRRRFRLAEVRVWVLKGEGGLDPDLRAQEPTCK